MTTAIAMTEPDMSATLGIIAGSGDLPRQLVEGCLKNGRNVYVVAIENETDPKTFENMPHVVIRLGAIGAALEYFKNNNVSELVLAGKINRPSISGLLPDALGAKLLSKLGLSLFGGDAKIFKTIIAFLEEEGFRVLGVDDLLKDFVTPEGPLGRHIPDKQAQKDIELGVEVVRTIGELDIGQAVIVKNGLVLGVEAAEGTDALIARCAELRGEGRGGVLVKARKSIQEERVDLPTIGTKTIELVSKGGFSGVAIESKHSLIVNQREVVRMADALGIFIIGFTLHE